MKKNPRSNQKNNNNIIIYSKIIKKDYNKKL